MTLTSARGQRGILAPGGRPVIRERLGTRNSERASSIINICIEISAELNVSSSCPRI